MDEVIPEYGEFDVTAEYVLRPGGYAVIRNHRGEIALVETPKGYFLPGGGQDDGESPKGAAVREAKEECGLSIQVSRFLGIADELVVSGPESRTVRKRCSFFAASVVGFGASEEDDHRLFWLPMEQAVRRLSHQSQVWAVVRESE